MGSQFQKRVILGRDSDGVDYTLPLQDSGTALAVKSGGFGIELTPTLSIGASASYAAGDVLGHLLTISGPCRTPGVGGIIENVSVSDLGGLDASLDIIFFKQNPASTTFTDNGALAVDPNDVPKVAGVAHISDWTGLGTPSYGQDHNFNGRFQLSATVNTLYAVVVARSTVSLTASNALQPKFNISSD
jgi:hypothetical protein